MGVSKHLSFLRSNRALILATIVVLGIGALMLSRKGQVAHVPRAQAAYVASELRDPFHKPSCRWAKKISRANLEGFASRDDAINAGHRPCKVCRP